MRSVSGPSGLPVIGKAKEASTVKARIQARTHTVGDLDRRIEQIDMAIEEPRDTGSHRTQGQYSLGYSRCNDDL